MQGERAEKRGHAGKEYWKSRLHPGGETIHRYTKYLTHKKERRDNKKIIEKEKMQDLTVEVMKEKIQLGAEALSNLCLLEAERYHGYTDEDLINASMIFSHFLMEVLYRENKYLPQPKLEDLAETAGEAIRQLIMSCTGKDMHKIVKESLRKN